MNELVTCCSAALLRRLSGPGATEANVISLAEARIAREIAGLPPLASRIVRWRFGVGCPSLTEQEIAQRLRISVGRVESIRDEALLQVGFALVTAEAAA